MCAHEYYDRLVLLDFAASSYEYLLLGIGSGGPPLVHFLDGVPYCAVVRSDMKSIRLG